MLGIIGILSGVLCGLYGVGALLAGLYLGMASSKVLDEKVVKKLVIVMLILSGVALVVNNL